MNNNSITHRIQRTEFASDLKEYGFTPGVFPATVTIDGITYKRGLFVFRRVGEDQELERVLYSAAASATMVVFND
jgi:hypothetical protein